MRLEKSRSRRRALAGAWRPAAARALAACLILLALACGSQTSDPPAGARAQAEQEGSPSARWTFEILDPGGSPTPARVSLWSATGAPLYPANTRAHVDEADDPYFYTDGVFALPAGVRSVRLRVQKGFEYAVVDSVLHRDGERSRIRLERAFDLPALGLYSGDGHVHPNFGPPATHLGNRDLLRQMHAEDLNLANLLAANAYGARIFLADRVTGRSEPESEPDFVLRVSEEYRSKVYGHMSVYGVGHLGDPLFSAVPDSPYPFDFPTNYEAAHRYAEEGAFASFAHLRPPEGLGPGAHPGLKALEAPADVALGAIRALEIQGPIITRLALPVWERLMSSGFDVVVSAGTDAFLGYERATPLGSTRAYVDLEGRDFSYDTWTRQLARGRAFTTNGPLVFLKVDGQRPGQTLELAPGERREVELELEVASVFPWDHASVRANGRDALVFASDPGHSRRQSFRGRLALEGPGWIYAHVWGDAEAGTPQRREAVTNAVWVTRAGELRRDAESLAYFVRWIDDNLAVLEARDNYGSPANRAAVRSTFLRAREVFATRLAQARGGAAAGSLAAPGGSGG